uniref:Uncharacterized protein n=1 Tax=Plectus sambesii TaxID=2011161 RepID=A0A914X8D0_9BILA
MLGSAGARIIPVGGHCDTSSAIVRSSSSQSPLADGGQPPHSERCARLTLGDQFSCLFTVNRYVSFAWWDKTVPPSMILRSSRGVASAAHFSPFPPFYPVRRLLMHFTMPCHLYTRTSPLTKTVVATRIYSFCLTLGRRLLWPAKDDCTHAAACRHSADV